MAKPAPDIKSLGRYEIESVLGKGAMGIVYAGNDTRLQRKVAIKTILKSALEAQTAAEYSMRFDREARAVARLNHPNIVQVYDFGEEGDVAYIVMEFIKGRELKAFFDANERFELREAVHIMGELCEALHFAHEAGVVHRDIKPANIIIDTQGRVKLADFGVARITDAERGATEKTQAGAVVGTPAYMSPEQIEGKDIDRRTDIFSAGIILYQFLTGEKPFTGEGTWTIAKKILQDEPARPSTVNATVSPIFDAVVSKALAKSVSDRYQTARDLGTALKNALEGKAEPDEEKTVIGFNTPLVAPATAAPAPARSAQSSTQELDLEFWRAIKDGDDPHDFDLYVEQFPTGIYTALAKRKAAKLRGGAAADATATSLTSLETERREVEEAARREAEAKAKLAEETARLQAEMAKREEELARRAAEFEERNAAEAKARAEAEAKSKAEFEAALAKREAALQTREQNAARIEKSGRKPWVIAATAAAVIIAIVVAVFTVLKPGSSAREAELLKMLEEAKKANAELVAAREREQELLKQVEDARAKEEEAKRSGDVAKQQEMAALTRQREAEAQKQAELTRKREAEAQRQNELAKQRQEELRQAASARDKQAESARQAAEARQAADKAAAEKAAAAERAAAEQRAAQERQAAERAAAEKAAQEQRAAAERAAAQQAAAEKAAADRQLAEKAAAEKQAAAQKAAADKASTQVAAVDRDALFKQAQAADDKGDMRIAVRLYRDAARAGNGQAAKRLGDIYNDGKGEVTRDYAEALRWYAVAEKAGVKVEKARGR